MYLQLSGKQSAHFGNVVIVTVDSVVRLFFAVLPFAWAVWRRPSYLGLGGCPGLICGKGTSRTDYPKVQNFTLNINYYIYI